jgi:hypothetical protein
MKKTISYFSAMVLTLAGGQGALAQEAEEGFVESFANFFQPNWERDFSVTVGVKVWLNEWTRDSFISQDFGFPQFPTTFFLASGQSSTRPQTQISDIEPTPIPQIGIRYKRLVVAASYYPETDFDFPISESTIFTNLFPSPGGGVLGISGTRRFDTTAEREEWDAALGVYVLYPYVVILGGYKEIDQKFSETVTDNFLTTLDGVGQQSSSSALSSSKIKISGPTIGISGSAPMAYGFGLYANYAHGFMDSDITELRPGTTATVPVAATFDAEYDVAEFGFTYNTKEWLPHMPLSVATVYAGYRYQDIETEFEGLFAMPFGNRKDTTKGFVAGINLSW